MIIGLFWIDVSNAIIKTAQAQKNENRSGSGVSCNRHRVLNRICRMVQNSQEMKCLAFEDKARKLKFTSKKTKE